MISEKLKNTGKKLQITTQFTMLPYGLRNALRRMLFDDVPKPFIPIP